MPLIINSATRQVLIQLDLDTATGALTVPDTGALTVPDTGALTVGDTGDKRTRRDLGVIHEACEQNTGTIRVELEHKRDPVVLDVTERYISYESFDKLAKSVEKICLKDYNTLVESIKCLRGFEQDWEGLLKVNDRNSTFDVLGRFKFQSLYGAMETMDFRIHEIYDYGEQLKQIEANYYSSLDHLISQNKDKNIALYLAIKKEINSTYSGSIRMLMQQRNEENISFNEMKKEIKVNYSDSIDYIIRKRAKYAVRSFGNAVDLGEEFGEIYGNHDRRCSLCQESSDVIVSDGTTVLLHAAALPFIFLFTVLVL